MFKPHEPSRAPNTEKSRWGWWPYAVIGVALPALAITAIVGAVKMYDAQSAPAPVAVSTPGEFPSETTEEIQKFPSELLDPAVHTKDGSYSMVEQRLCTGMNIHEVVNVEAKTGDGSVLRYLDPSHQTSVPQGFYSISKNSANAFHGRGAVYVAGQAEIMSMKESCTNENVALDLLTQFSKKLLAPETTEVRLESERGPLVLRRVAGNSKMAEYELKLPGTPSAEQMAELSQVLRVHFNMRRFLPTLRSVKRDYAYGKLVSFADSVVLQSGGYLMLLETTLARPGAEGVTLTAKLAITK